MQHAPTSGTEIRDGYKFDHSAAEMVLYFRLKFCFRSVYIAVASF
jgi:hypothetical protein